MLLDQLTLHNVGTYLGRQSAVLTPTCPNQPVVLFGGLNGAGKTTILDALQLCLYGPHANCSGRKNLSYEDYLLQTISRGADVPEAAVELSFRHMRDGRESRYQIHRSWAKTGKGCTERLEVIVNGRLDPLLTENWGEQVEEFLPSRIAPLFLYDGEKIEGYADPQSSARMIATAVYNLLGLNLVEKLSADLVLLERRKRTETKDAVDRERITALENEFYEVEQERRASHQRQASLRTKLGQARKRLHECEEKYRQEGGALYERRTELEASQARARTDHTEVSKKLLEFVAGPAPLLLIKDLLADVAAADAHEAKTLLIRDTATILKERDQDILKNLSSWGVGDKSLAKLKKYLQQDIEGRAGSYVEPVFALSPEARAILAELRAEVLLRTERELFGLLEQETLAQSHLEDAAAAVVAIPTADALAAVVAQRKHLLAEVASLEVDLRKAETEEEVLTRDIDRRSRELERLRREATEEQVAVGETLRVISYSEKVRNTLVTFRGEIVRRHVERIETLVLDSLKQLLRKDSLVKTVRIDPGTFALDLNDKNGNVMPPERLSAGERQLLSVAILWGLARTSRRPLPTIIDTPLGRLDSTHRKLLLTRYFPHASHQVILLSTDEEIFGSYYDSLKPWIGRSYELEFDDTLSATTIREGYFGGEARHGH
ncbi:MAG: DNA sulfur modification protein DndD [Alphaproteobacteria bacterium]|nr:DNA sulfur modification protein DndD [Alphaproteobacteria bacterium]